MTQEDDSWWSALVDVLSSTAAVRAREPYGLVVSRQRPDGPPLDVEIVMAPGEWEEFVSVPYGDVEPALQYVRDLVAEQREDMGYLVYNTYELVPSATADLPPDPDLLEREALAKPHPDGVIPGGGWWANPPEAR